MTTIQNPQYDVRSKSELPTSACTPQAEEIGVGSSLRWWGRPTLRCGVESVNHLQQI
jgi:hypothetical protein